MLFRPFFVFFVALMFAPFSANTLEAQLSATELDDMRANAESMEMLEKIDRMESALRFSPNRKNPLAAGRLKVVNKTAPELQPVVVERLTGPAYKNRKLAVPTVTADNVAPAPTTVRQRLTGPRYKNRTAKTGRNQ